MVNVTRSSHLATMPGYVQRKLMINTNYLPMSCILAYPLRIRKNGEEAYDIITFGALESGGGAHIKFGTYSTPLSDSVVNVNNNLSPICLYIQL